MEMLDSVELTRVGVAHGLGLVALVPLKAGTQLWDPLALFEVRAAFRFERLVTRERNIGETGSHGVSVGASVGKCQQRNGAMMGTGAALAYQRRLR